MRQKVSFLSQGRTLAGLLETPDQPIRSYVLFAHCFTCGKDIVAATRISRHLVQQGFAVFRYDFAGLGNSECDFSNTTVSLVTWDYSPLRNPCAALSGAKSLDLIECV